MVRFDISGLLCLIAIVLMVTGYSMETMDYDIVLGALLFTVGFWLFVIPLIILGVIMSIMALVYLAVR